MGYHLSHVVPSDAVQPGSDVPVMVRVTGGHANYIATNHTAVWTTTLDARDNAYAAEVEALTTTATSRPATAVLVDAGSTDNVILGSGTDDEVVADRKVNTVRPPHHGTKQLTSKQQEGSRGLRHAGRRRRGPRLPSPSAASGGTSGPLIFRATRPAVTRTYFPDTNDDSMM